MKVIRCLVLMFLCFQFVESQSLIAYNCNHTIRDEIMSEPEPIALKECEYIQTDPFSTLREKVRECIHQVGHSYTKYILASNNPIHGGYIIKDEPGWISSNNGNAITLRKCIDVRVTINFTSPIREHCWNMIPVSYAIINETYFMEPKSRILYNSAIQIPCEEYSALPIIEVDEKLFRFEPEMTLVKTSKFSSSLDKMTSHNRLSWTQKLHYERVMEAYNDMIKLSDINPESRLSGWDYKFYSSLSHFIPMPDATLILCLVMTVISMSILMIQFYMNTHQNCKRCNCEYNVYKMPR